MSSHLASSVLHNVVEKISLPLNQGKKHSCLCMQAIQLTKSCRQFAGVTSTSDDSSLTSRHLSASFHDHVEMPCSSFIIEMHFSRF